MSESGPSVGLVRFGVFELDLRSGELRERGVKVNLQGQPFQILALLVQRPGEVVSREELQKKLWPTDTFGDFEDGLNKAIQKIRIALKDSAANPRFIETLQRRGYRFICPIESPPPPAPIRSTGEQKAEKVLLAVLPFENLSEGPGQEHFSEGLTEEMITNLGMISPRKLGVIAGRAMMKFRNTNVSLAEIGRELAADYVLDGSVRRSGDRIRIIARLTDVTDQTLLWSVGYERSLTDVFAVQTDVAKSIAEHLEVELLPGHSPRPAEPSPEAYECYLNGRYLWNKRTEEGLSKAIGYFQRALDDEPGYAQAYAGIADCYAMLGWNSMLPPDTALPEAKKAAIKALKLNNRLAEAHASLAFCKMFHDWEWKDAEDGFKKALDLNPSYPAARPWYAFELSALGRHTKAIEEVQRALQLDPFSLAIGASAGLVLSLAGQHDKAIQRCQRTLEMDSNTFYQTYFVLGASYAAKHMFQQAVDALQKAVHLSNRNPHMVAALGNALAVSERASEARALITELREREAGNYVSPFNIAMVYAGLGEKDETFEWLEKAYECKSLWLIFLNVHPMFEDLRSDPRLKSLVRRMGLTGEDPFSGGPGDEGSGASDKICLSD